MGGAVRTSVPGTTALLATVLCTLALLAPNAQAASGKATTGIHPVKIVAVGSPHQHALTLRADQPQVLSAGSRPSMGGAFGAATATSATIAPSCTADSPLMRGPPAHGCS